MHSVDYSLTIEPNAPGVHKGSKVRVWLPYPQEYRQQRDVKLLSASPQPTQIDPPAVDGDPVSGGAQRTVYFEQTVQDPAKPVEFKMSFQYVSYAYDPKLDDKDAQPLPAGAMKSFLAERPPHIVFTDGMKQQVAKIVGDETNSLARAQNLPLGERECPVECGGRIFGQVGRAAISAPSQTSISPPQTVPSGP